MKFSLTKALGSPFGFGLLLMAFFIGLPTMSFVFMATQLEISNINLFMVVIAVIYVLCYLVTLGYAAASGHRYIYNLKPTVPPFNFQLLKIGLKGLLFAFNTLVLLLALWLLLTLFFNALFAITTHPALIFLIIPLIIVIGIGYAFYMMTAWARFMDTFRPSLVFSFPSNWIFMKRYWTKLLRVILFIVGVSVILFIPLVFIIAAAQVAVDMHVRLIYAYIYITGLTQAYLLMVNVNVLAQAYAWIKNEHDNNFELEVKLAHVENPHLIEEEPVVMKDIVILSDLKSNEPQTTKIKVSSKTGSKAKPATGSKVKSVKTTKKTPIKSKKS